LCGNITFFICFPSNPSTLMKPHAIGKKMMDHFFSFFLSLPPTSTFHK
jgi:hypothetical protein